MTGACSRDESGYIAPALYEDAYIIRMIFVMNLACVKRGLHE